MSVENSVKPMKHKPHVKQNLDVANNENALLQVSTVCQLLGCGRSSLYKLMREGNFVKAIKRGARCTRFRAGDVTAWLRAQAS